MKPNPTEMKKICLLTLAILLLNISCEKAPVSDLSKNSIIPKPQSIENTGEYFVFSSRTKLRMENLENIVPDLGKMLTAGLSVIANDGTQQEKSAFRKRFNTIVFTLRKDSLVQDEQYFLEIEKKTISLTSSSSEGLYRGIQTLLQLASLGGSDVKRGDGVVAIPTGTISDFPEYKYRGTMLDVSRHFFGPDVVKKYIEILAVYKINYLHLHLSDDQGWRIEIKSWPKLTETGGSTEVGGGKGGFYTQEEYKDLVAYAAKRFITIVPEIDMPGHTNAALASYSELNCNGISTELYTGTNVGFSTLCTRSEITYTFVDDVVREISEMTPGPYFHVGGDESHVTDLPDYIYFIDRVKKIVNSYGKQMIGWDEVSHAALDSNDIAQYWASSENAQRAKLKGANLIYSPARYCYLDMKYDSLTLPGLHWAGYINVQAAYGWNPPDLVEGLKKENILGIESPLWAETIETLDDIEYLAFPRLIGHAEIAWSNNDSLSWEDYSKRLEYHKALLKKKSVNFYVGD